MKVTSELLYSNRFFYKKALLIRRQNSFSEHFHEMLFSVISMRFQEIMKIGEGHVFQIEFFTDAIVMAYKKWIIKESEMSPDMFMEELKVCFEIMEERIKKE